MGEYELTSVGRREVVQLPAAARLEQGDTQGGRIVF